MNTIILPGAIIAAVSLPVFATEYFDIEAELLTFGSQSYKIYLDAEPVSRTEQEIRLRFWAQCADASCKSQRFQRQVVRDFEQAMSKGAFGVSTKTHVLPCDYADKGCPFNYNAATLVLETDVTPEELASHDLNVFDLVIVMNMSESGVGMPLSACNYDTSPSTCLTNTNFQFSALSPTSFSVTYETDWNDADQRDDEQELHHFTQKAGYYCKERAQTRASHVRVTLTCDHQGEQKPQL
ncbi:MULTISPECIES: hypothetical protein [unclassified Pseudoalteromonas]|uniref:hypothetical protein n=1 Tax=unclassified Pseudoalteromonas TaxID=194690 RepID=UPI00209831F0|nr:hypothetical protein [Pseudoalteromonas sp. XMcav2-N]MCO7190108.1 hypothetical protein [Pseudoalteromonas sp. XMcav2-N]